MMKNIALFVLLFFCVSCDNLYIDPGDSCCSEEYTLSLFFLKDSDEADDILSGDYIDYKNVYFYYLNNAKNVVKIPTTILFISSSQSGIPPEISFFIYSRGADIYAPFADKGLSTIYLHKRNNKVDTLQIDVSKTVQDDKTSYIMNQVTINSKNPRSRTQCHSLGYCYYLKP